MNWKVGKREGGWDPGSRASMKSISHPMLQTTKTKTMWTTTEKTKITIIFRGPSVLRPNQSASGSCVTSNVIFFVSIVFQ